MILIGYTIQEADRLGEPVKRFLGRVADEAFAVSGAYQEFESVLDGYERDTGIGLHESLVSDLVKLSDILDDHPGEPVEKVLDLAGIIGNERDHVSQLVNNLMTGVKDTNDCGRILRECLFRWESVVARRRSELRNRIPRWEPTDLAEVARVEEALLNKWPGGGSWKRDSKIFAQTHSRACKDDVVFVTEDINHYGKRRETLLSMTKVREIENLNGDPITR